MLGGPQYRAEMVKAGLATKEMALANAKLGESLAISNKRSFLQNQLLFTARRALFYTTLGVIGLSAEVLKMGFSYDNAMQSASVALQQVIKPQKALNEELNKLFVITSQTPFQVKDVTQTFRQMYIAFKPFHVGIGTLNDTIQAITNNLAATGKESPASLNRVSTALAHVANVGHLTGQAVLQLARDGLQLYPALRKELHLTGDQMANIGKAGIPARDVLMALIKYSKTTPGIMDAAFRQANFTLSGAFTTFKDFVSQASGGALGGPSGTGGVFGGLQKDIVGINKHLTVLAQSGKAISMMDVAKAVDQQLTPKTHAIINLFITFTSVLKTMVIELGFLLKAIGLLFRPVDWLTSLFGVNHAAAKVLGIVLGTLGTILVIGTGIWTAYRVAVDAARGVMIGIRTAILLTTAAQAAQNFLMTGSGESGMLNRWRTWSKMQKEMESSVINPRGGKSFGKVIVQAEEGAASYGILGVASRKFLAGLDALKVSRFTTAIKGLFTTFKTAGFVGSLKLIGQGIVKFGIALWGLVPAFITLIGESWALFVANLWWAWIPITIMLIIGVLVLLYRKWQWFHDLVNNVARDIKKYWEYFFPLILIVQMLIKLWGVFVSVIEQVANALMRVAHWIAKIPGFHLVMGAIAGAVHWLGSSDVHATRHKAAGGYVFGGGSVLVGERGPEVVNLPGGSNVIPNNQLSNVRPVGFQGGAGNDRPIVVQVMLDRKVLAEGVARANQDYAARR